MDPKSPEWPLLVGRWTTYTNGPGPWTPVSHNHIFQKQNAAHETPDTSKHFVQTQQFADVQFPPSAREALKLIKNEGETVF